MGRAEPGSTDLQLETRTMALAGIDARDGPGARLCDGTQKDKAGPLEARLLGLVDQQDPWWVCQTDGRG